MQKNNQRTLGVIILVIGLALLLKQLGIIFPDWLFSWPMILIALGVIIGIKNGFTNTGALVLLAIGGFFLLRNHDLLPYGTEKYLLPVGLILIGLFLLARKKSKAVSWEGNFDRFERKLRTGKAGKGKDVDRADYIYEEAIFCSLKRKNASKAFKGGQVTTIFASTDIDLSQAELEEIAVLDVSVIMGGIKLIVPRHWEILFQLDNIAAGVDDKRVQSIASLPEAKKLVITGTVILGSLEVRGY